MITVATWHCTTGPQFRLKCAALRLGDLRGKFESDLFSLILLAAHCHMHQGMYFDIYCHVVCPILQFNESKH